MQTLALLVDLLAYYQYCPHTLLHMSGRGVKISISLALDNGHECEHGYNWSPTHVAKPGLPFLSLFCTVSPLHQTFLFFNNFFCTASALHQTSCPFFWTTYSVLRLPCIRCFFFLTTFSLLCLRCIRHHVSFSEQLFLYCVYVESNVNVTFLFEPTFKTFLSQMLLNIARNISSGLGFCTICSSGSL